MDSRAVSNAGRAKLRCYRAWHLWAGSVFLVVMVGLLSSGCGRSPGTPTAASGVTLSSPAPSPTAGCPAPSARINAALVYQSSNKQVLLFGGFGNDVYGDTWLFSSHCWRQVSPAVSPSPRFLAAYAFDPAKSVAMLYGGRQAPAASDLFDTWIWDGSNWSQASVGTGPNMRAPVAAYDPRSGKVLVFGLSSDWHSVETWTWDGSWQQLHPASAPTVRFSSGMAYDGNTGHLILFGGRDGSHVYLSETWSWDGANWIQLKPAQSPSPRMNPSMVSFNNGVLLYGGLEPSRENNDTWTWDGQTWRQFPTAHTPPAQASELGLSDGGVIALTASSGTPKLATYELTNDWSAI